MRAFDRIDKERRQEWFDSPVTRAYLQTLAAEQRLHETAIIEAARVGQPASPVLGGYSSALHWAVRLAQGELSHDVAR
jgi:hypothetical protein